MAYDEASHRVVPAPVVRTFRHDGHRVGQLALSSGETLRVTSNHPVYLPDELAYAEAGSVTSASRLIRLGGPREVRSAIAEGFFMDSQAATETVFNIEVATHHNYFAAGVLVHNKSGGSPACYFEKKVISWDAICDTSAPCVDPDPNSGVGGAGGAGGAAGAPPDGGTAADSGGGVGGGGVSGAGGVAGGAGAAGAAGAPGYVGVGSLRREFCDGKQPPGRSLIAFDVKTSDAMPTISIVSGDKACSGDELAQVWPDAGSGAWQSVCTWFDSGDLVDSVAVVSANPQDEFRDLRFVNSCPCEFDKKVWNECNKGYSDRVSKNSCQ